MSLRCKQGEMARVARDTIGGTCASANLNMVVYCDEVQGSTMGPVWVLRGNQACASCGVQLFGFLDADLEPIRPPAAQRDLIESVNCEPPRTEGALL